MQKTMSSKKKIIIALASLTIAMLVVLGALIAVYAAGWQGVASSFTVKYDIADNVAVKTTTYYQYAGEKTTKVGSLTFHLDGIVEDENGEEVANSTLSIPDLTLNTDTRAVRLIYLFENISDNKFSLYADWTGLDYADSSENTNNKNVHIVVDTFDIVDNTVDPITTIGASAFSTETGIHDFTTKPGYASVSRGEIAVLMITISVNNPNLTAFCKSSTTGGLGFALNYVA